MARPVSHVGTEPPPGTPPPAYQPPPYQPPPYAGTPYYGAPMGLEGLLTKRMIWVLNVVGILGIFVGFLVDLSRPTDYTAIAFARVVAFGGGLVAVVASLAGALASRRTTDSQNLGLLIWAGLLLLFTASFAFTIG